VRILVADDDRVLVHMLCARLRSRGFEAVPAFDAMQAWMVAQRQPIDAIVLDIQMPGGTGIEVLRKLKSFSRTCMTPVIVLSGSIDPQDVQVVKNLGADEYLPKPPDVDLLCETLSRLVGQASGTSARGS
jgi:DNA-binding response OmpR family regulator